MLAIMDEQPTKMPALAHGQHEICLGTQFPYDVVSGMELWRRVKDDEETTSYSVCSLCHAIGDDGRYLEGNVDRELLLHGIATDCCLLKKRYLR